MVRRKSIIGALAIGLLLLGMPSLAAAQSLTPGISVSPAQLTLDIDASADTSTSVTISNDYPVPLGFQAAFQGIDEQAGRLIPVGEPEAALKTNLRLSQTSFTIPAHSALVLGVSIANQQDIAPGGHYATLVLTQQQAGGTQLGLKASVSLSLFVLKSDGARADTTADSLMTDGWLFKLPSVAKLRFVNHGNIHAVPRASVRIERNGEPVRIGTANQTSLPVLPGDSLLSTVTLKNSLRNIWVPARLQVVADYRIDGSDSVRTLTRSFTYIPPIYPLGVCALIAVPVIFVMLRQKRRPTPTQPEQVTTIAAEPVIEPPVTLVPAEASLPEPAIDTTSIKESTDELSENKTSTPTRVTVVDESETTLPTPPGKAAAATSKPKAPKKAKPKAKRATKAATGTKSKAAAKPKTPKKKTT